MTPREARRMAAVIVDIKEMAVGEKNAHRGMKPIRAFIAREIAKAGPEGAFFYISEWKWRVAALQAIAEGAELVRDEPADISWLRLIEARLIWLRPAASDEDLI